jgi:NAD(P)-dependent dehydrogenase (short-subunit alcohol dehydrogenase family)
VIALTKAIAVDHGADGIRANCVAPGPVYTPMVYARGMTEQARDTRRQASVLKRERTGWDIGGAVRFLLSDQARYITGHVLIVDGGARLSARAGIAVSWTAGNKLARHAREGSSAGSTFTRLLGCER